jgi:hypothetical protein
MPRLRRSLLAVSMSAAVMLSACGGSLKQVDDAAPAPKAPEIGVIPLPPYPEPLPYLPPDDELPGGHGWPTWGDCSDSLAC